MILNRVTDCHVFSLPALLRDLIDTVITEHRVCYAQFVRQPKCHSMDIMAYLATFFIFYSRKWTDLNDRILFVVNNISHFFFMSSSFAVLFMDNSHSPRTKCFYQNWIASLFRH